MRILNNGLLKTLCIALMPICSAGAFGALDRDTGDELAAKLRLGMTQAEMVAALGKPMKLVDDEALQGFGKVQDEREINTFYDLGDRYPYNVLKTVKVGTPYWRYTYWGSPHFYYSLNVFLSDDLNYVRGWTKVHSEYSRDKYLHEKLTTRLRVTNDSRSTFRARGMSHAEVHKLIGPPNETVDIPISSSRRVYEDYFWWKEIDLFLPRPPYTKMEVYTYKMDTGLDRHIYLIYSYRADQLWNWGYDQAGEEATRYLRESETHH